VILDHVGYIDNDYDYDYDYVYYDFLETTTRRMLGCLNVNAMLFCM